MTTGIDLESLLKEFIDGVFVCTKEGDIIYSNPAFASMLGYKEADVKGRNVGKDLVERNLEWKALTSLIDQGSIIADYEIKFKRPDGAVIIGSLSASSLRGADGIPTGITGVLRDITTRKAVENELRDRAFRTDIINKIARITGADTNVKTRVLVNLASELHKLVNFDLIMVCLAEENGRHVEILTPDPKNPGAPKTLGTVLLEGSLVEKLRFARQPLIVDRDAVRRQYTEFSVVDLSGISSFLGVPLVSRGRVLGALCIGYAKPSEYNWDTADTMQMIADQVAGLIDNLMLVAFLEARIKLQDSLVKTGLAIQKAISTEQVYAAIAATIKEVVPYSELSFYVIDWQKRQAVPVYAAGSDANEVMASPGTLDEGIVGIVAKSGVAEFTDDVDADPRSADIPGIPAGHNAMLAIPLLGTNDVLGVLELYRPKGQVFTVADLEAGKLFAQQASVALENAHLVFELQEAKEEIEMLNDLMFHDINNFNFASMNYIEIVCKSQDLPAAEKVHLEKSLQLIRQTAALIENVKKLTKIGGLSQKDFVSVDLSEVLRKIVSGLENSFPGKNISVTLNVPDTCFVTANSLVEELFVNLLSNSVKYDPHDEVEIEVDAERVVEDGRHWWRVCISDRGHGVPEEKKALLFQKYVRLRPDAKTPGAGLGLSICRALVDKFGGRIWVEDRVPGKSELGARFCVTLPAAKGN
jgi:PAS domain S-box-containing protein